MHRTEVGTLAFDTTGANLDGGYRSSQSGWYAQGAYQFMPRWRVGLRYEELHSGDTDIGLVNSGVLNATDFPRLAEHDPRRTTAMIDFSPSEFSRFRLQFARDEARFSEADNQIFLQYIMSLGTHGAQNMPLTDRSCNLNAAYIAFVKASLAQRYASREDYVERIRAAGRRLVSEGFLLEADALEIERSARSAPLW